MFARNKSAVMDADKDAVEVAEGDLLDPATVEKALDGVDKLYQTSLKAGFRATGRRRSNSVENWSV